MKSHSPHKIRSNPIISISVDTAPPSVTRKQRLLLTSAVKQIQLPPRCVLFTIDQLKRFLQFRGLSGSNHLPSLQLKKMNLEGNLYRNHKDVFFILLGLTSPPDSLPSSCRSSPGLRSARTCGCISRRSSPGLPRGRRRSAGSCSRRGRPG